MQARNFAIPKDGEMFIDLVLARCKDLIDSGIWDGQLSHVRLDTWMRNFATDTERYFGACVLDALIYRSDRQTVALMEQLFQRNIPDLVRRFSPNGDSRLSWLDKLREPFQMTSPQIRIIPVLKLTDPPTKSGLLLARLYRRGLGLNEAWMLWPWQIEAAKRVGIKQFLFIDDFLGTGDQFCEFADQFSLLKNLEGCYGVYAPLTAHVDGIAKVRKEIPTLGVVAVEVIDHKYSLFSSQSNWFNDQTNTPASARAFYDNLVGRVQFPIKPEANRGYGKLALAYAFNHATPDNCLPILWAEGRNWKPLLPR
ncbi:conserved hypothetical protein [Verrucomicrobia bacterium]|nr:conserved hypothetical protein [Verrucomicrobiota bacterium]